MILPRWDEVRDLALAAAQVTPQLRYSSWDIAIRQDDVLLIEGNWDAEFYAEQQLWDKGSKEY